MKGIVKVVFGVVLALGASSPASATILEIDADNEAFFRNFENLFDATGAWKSPGSLPAVGDHLAGILHIQNIDANGLTIFDGVGPDAQLTGIFAQRIIAISPSGADPLNPLQALPHVQLGAPTIGTYCKGTDCFSAGLAAGEVFRFYLQVPGTTQFESNGTMADDVAKATDGSLWLSLGLGLNNGAGPDGIFGTTDDLGYLYSHSNPGDGNAFGALNAVVNNTGLPFLRLNDPNESELGGTTLLTDVYLTSEFERNPSTSSPWALRSNDPAVLHPVSEASSGGDQGLLHPVPEVSSLWMLAMGLTGLVSRRRKVSNG